MTFKQFEKQVNAAGLQARDCGKYHWQIIGGHLLVSFYPVARRGPIIYIAGTTKGFGGTIESAIESARRIPEKLPTEGRKNGGYKKYKHRMLRKNPICYWCHTPLTQETASVDHKIPLALGGLNCHNNYVLACVPCNSKKGHSLWKEPV